MITSRKFEPEDWKKIDDAIEPFSYLCPDIDVANRSVAMTCADGDTIMACGGITYTGDNDGIIWLKLSKKCRKRRYFWARTVLETFRIMKDVIGGLKLHTYVLDKFCRGEKTARLIGLRKTGEFEEYKGNIYYKYTAVI